MICLQTPWRRRLSHCEHVRGRLCECSDMDDVLCCDLPVSGVTGRLSEQNWKPSMTAATAVLLQTYHFLCQRQRSPMKHCFCSDFLQFLTLNRWPDTSLVFQEILESKLGSTDRCKKMEALDKQGVLGNHKMQRTQVCWIFRSHRSCMFGIDEILQEKPLWCYSSQWWYSKGWPSQLSWERV